MNLYLSFGAILLSSCMGVGDGSEVPVGLDEKAASWATGEVFAASKLVEVIGKAKEAGAAAELDRLENAGQSGDDSLGTVWLAAVQREILRGIEEITSKCKDLPSDEAVSACYKSLYEAERKYVWDYAP